MKLRIDKTLRFWVVVDCDHIKSDYPKLTKRQLLAHILRQYEACGDQSNVSAVFNDRNGREILCIPKSETDAAKTALFFAPRQLARRRSNGDRFDFDAAGIAS